MFAYENNTLRPMCGPEWCVLSARGIFIVQSLRSFDQAEKRSFHDQTWEAYYSWKTVELWILGRIGNWMEKSVPRKTV